LEIYKATRDADAIIICLSTVSVKKEGYVNKEIRHALDIAQEKPEGAIYVIPLRLDDCKPSFEQLKKLQWVDYFTPNAHERLLKSLHVRAEVLKIEFPEEKVELVLPSVPKALEENDVFDLFRFIRIERQKFSVVPYSFWIGKYPVTNAQYERFLNAPDFGDKIYWLEFPQFDKKCQPIGNSGTAGADWLKERFEKYEAHGLLPRYWDNKYFGKVRSNHPVIGINWYEANAYCKWLFQNWDNVAESQANYPLKPKSIRLPLETEWVIAADGDELSGRYPWDEAGKETTSLDEIFQRANVRGGEIRSEITGQIFPHTSPVNQYPLRKSPFGVMDMAGNVWELQANFFNESQWPVMRGGSWDSEPRRACVSSRHYGIIQYRHDWEMDVGFRMVIIA